MKMGNPEMVQPREPVAQDGFVYQMEYVQVRFIYISKKYSQISQNDSKPLDQTNDSCDCDF